MVGRGTVLADEFLLPLDRVTAEAVALHCPDLIVAPFLKRATTLASMRISWKRAFWPPERRSTRRQK